MTTRVEVWQLLRAYGVDINKWGVGEAKTLDHLWAELRTGEAVLEIKGHKVVRKAVGLGVDVFYRHPAWSVLRLYEALSIFSDGRERRRVTYSSVAGKMLPGEDPKDAARREVREELGIAGIGLVNYRPFYRNAVPSETFPGLLSCYAVTHMFDTYLSAEQYCPEGYVEEQNDKTTFFKWRMHGLMRI